MLYRITGIITLFLTFFLYAETIEWKRIESKIQIKDYKKATLLLDIALDKLEHPPFIYYKLRGDTELGLGRIDSAIENYKESVKINKE